MFGKATASEKVYFALFSEMAETVLETAHQLDNLVNDYTDLTNKIKKIEELEHKCDFLAHKTLDQLNKSFITPIDREDIYLIVNEMDNIVDYIESTAHEFDILNIKIVTEETKQFTKLIIKAAEGIQVIMSELKNMSKSEILKQKLIEVNKIENEGDTLFRSTMKDLFSSTNDALHILRWHKVYECLEKALDACEDVADIIKGVVVKNA